MLVAFLIMLREGIEASLIVGIIAGYLARTGRRRFLGAVWAGVLAAAVLCLALGIALEKASTEFPQRQQELFESIVAFIAVGVLTSMVFWMKSAARSIKAQLHDQIDASLQTSRGGAIALVLMAFFAVGREGLESVFFLLATFEQSTGIGVPLGAILGLVAAVAFGLLIFYGGVRLNMRKFFRVTGAFIVIVAAGLLAGGLRSLHEAGVWNGLQQIVADWSAVLPKDDALGTVLAGLFGYNDMPTLGEALIYLAYLIPALIFFLMPARSGLPVPEHA
ncbi:MAG: FTR1 family protein [Beijerinckiaceae bacterium]|nr:FTR1 family protein [Beijerinckiaceae bacterium]